MRRHRETHQEPTIPCFQEDCNKLFSTEEQLRQHIRACHTKRDEIFECTYPNCGKSFGLNRLLTAHIKYRHTQERTHICPICRIGKSYSSFFFAFAIIKS